MKARTLALILKAMIAVTVGAILLLLWLGDRMSDAALLRYILVLPGSLLLWHIVLHLMPVRCDRAGCTGHMHHHWLKEADCEYRLQYICESCGEVYEMKISLTTGSGDAW